MFYTFSSVIDKYQDTYDSILCQMTRRMHWSGNRRIARKRCTAVARMARMPLWVLTRRVARPL